LSIVGRRGSSGFGWIWSRPPSGPHRPPLARPLLALAGVGVIALFVALALLAIWFSDGDDNSPAGTNSAPTATPAVTTRPSPTATPTPASGGQGPVFRLAAWDGERWQFSPLLEDTTYHEGEAIPFLFSVDDASPGAVYSVTIRYDCGAFTLLTSYDRDHGSRPALAAGGPESAAADTILSFPHKPGTTADDGGAGSLSLWGGSFAGVVGAPPSTACSGEKSLTVGGHHAPHVGSGNLAGGRKEGRAAAFDSPGCGRRGAEQRDRPGQRPAGPAVGALYSGRVS
jgi:hypothetical protein